MHLSSIGYINLISPYKHFYHIGKSNKKHVYPNPVNVNEYYESYKRDKSLTMQIRENIFEYEKLIKTNMSESIYKMYPTLKTTNELKQRICADLNKLISRLDMENITSKEQVKLTYLKKLEMKFSNNDEEYYLIMNKLEFGSLKTFKDIIPHKYQSKELSYFFENGDTLRIIRNNISHSTFIQIYLNKLNRNYFKKI